MWNYEIGLEKLTFDEKRLGCIGKMRFSRNKDHFTYWIDIPATQLRAKYKNKAIHPLGVVKPDPPPPNGI